MSLGTIFGKAVVAIATFEFDGPPNAPIAKVYLLGSQVSIVEVSGGVIEVASIDDVRGVWNASNLALIAILGFLRLLSTTRHDV